MLQVIIYILSIVSSGRSPSKDLVWIIVAKSASGSCIEEI